MPPFISESALRAAFHAEDTELIPAERVLNAIAEAHALLEARIAPAHLETPRPAGVERGALALSGAVLLRLLARGDALNAEQSSIGGQRLDTGKRFDALRALADEAEHEAWDALAPYLLATPAAESPTIATATTPILGMESGA